MGFWYLSMEDSCGFVDTKPVLIEQNETFRIFFKIILKKTKITGIS
jgi:hypothetical protein